MHTLRALVARLILPVVLITPHAAFAEYGLAARYPGDVGLASDPAVIHVFDYEDDSWKDGWGCSKWEYYDVSDEAGLAFDGNRCLVKHVPAGTNGASLTYDLEEPVNAMYHRVYARFAADTPSSRIIGISGVGEGIPQWKAMGSAGIPPDGTDYFCATLCTDYDDPLSSLWYPYHMDQKGDWGDNWPVEGQFPADRWFHLEIMVKMNTPNEPDGELRMWVEGKEVFARTDMRWRATEDVAVGRVIDQVYASQPFPKPGTFWMDNRVVATEYVGPYLALQSDVASQSDFDGDGVVRFGDFLMFVEHFGRGRGDGLFDDRYDLDADGKVGFTDFLAFASVFGNSVRSD